MLFMSCVCHAFASVHCCLVVTCWEMADLLALVCDVCVFVTFPCGMLGQVWYLIVLIPDLCHLSYFDMHHSPLTMDTIHFRSLTSTPFDGFSQDKCQQILKASLNYF